MTLDQRCAATTQRAISCIDDLMIADVRALAKADGDEARGRELEQVLRETPLSGPDEAREIHRSMCHADDSYADAVHACWSKPSCEAFVACVSTTRQHRIPTAGRGGR